MKTIQRAILAVAMLLAAQVLAQDFNGAKAVPYGKISRDGQNQQFLVQFPVEMNKVDDAFTVTCAPETKGYASWADNNSIWTYNLETEWPGLPGGANCTVTQVKDLTGIDGKVWKSGSIKYDIQIAGPKVTSFQPLGANGFFRESKPVVLVIFDGEIDPSSFFANQNAYLSYVSNNAPAEKIPLIPLSDDVLKELKPFIADSQGLDENKSNWILATVSPNLIPGAKLAVNVSNIVSKYSGKATDEVYAYDQLSVRGNFSAKVECARPAADSPICLPQGEIVLSFSAKTAWTGAKGAYIDYVPFGTKDGKRVRAYAELVNEEGLSYYQRAMNMVADYIPAAKKYSDTIVDQVVFKVRIEPQTTAMVTIPDGLTDVDGRPLMNTDLTTQLQIGSPKELIRVPQQISFFEKNIRNVSMPIGVVNLHQDIVFRKSGKSFKVWKPIRDPALIIKTIRAYADMSETRETPEYKSPMDVLGIDNNVRAAKLEGKKNHSTYLQLRFGADDKGVGGMYAAEVSSPSLEASESNAQYKSYLNPQYVISQVSNLSVHLKKGSTTTLAWVTTLDSGAPVANAALEVRNCMGEVVQSAQTDASGIASIENQAQWAKDCAKPEGSRDWLYGDTGEFFVFAKKDDDFTFVHSSWNAKDSYAMGAPGIEYFYSQMSEGTPFYHAVVGVNLVKPGQKVPVELYAKIPTQFGFTSVNQDRLPAYARVTYAYDEEVYFDFPITWANGSAEFVWNIPADSSVKLGQYNISLLNADKSYAGAPANADIEVAEFKVPIMSGSIAIPNKPLVRPASIPVNTTVRYANGVGAKDLAVSVSYFFQPSYVEFEGFEEFTFGTGKVEKTDAPAEKTDLPTEERAGLVEGVKTDANGSLTVDIAAQKLPSGKTIAETLATVKSAKKVIARARYMDQMGETQTLSTSKEIYTSDKYVGTKLVTGTMDKAAVQVAVVGADGKAADPKALSLKMYKVETKVIAEELFSGVIRNTYEREITDAKWNQSCSAEKSVISCSLSGLQAGTYGLEASLAEGQAGHVLFKVDANGKVYNSGSYFDFGDDEAKKQMPLALDKTSYKNGDKAVISFSAPFKSCAALVTLERQNVISAMVVADACEKGQVQVPVSDTLAPNVFVSVYAVTGRAGEAAVNLEDIDLGRPTYRIGFANLKVDIAKFKLAVDVSTDKKEYKAGEVVNVAFKVAPEVGTLKNAKVTYVAIEQKILDLKPNQTYDILAAFMQLRGHGVSTYTSLDRIETVTAKNAEGRLAAFEAAAGDARKGGSEGGDGGSQGSLKRKLFDALVDMKTVPVVNGVATAQFKANDSLTKFYVIAIVTDDGDKFGTGKAEYLATQDVETFANIPPVAYTGDGFPLKVNVRNNTTAEQTYTVRVTANSRDAAGNLVATTKSYEKQVKVGAASSVAADIADQSIADGVATIEYDIAVYDANGKLVDSLGPEVQKIYPAVPVSIQDSLVIQMDSANLSRSFSKAETALAGKGDMTASLSSSLVESVQSQIRSKLAAADSESSLFFEVKLNVALLTGSAKNPEALKKVLALMVNYTDSNGFVKYFPQSSQGSLWLTGALLQSLSTESWAVALVPDALKGKFAMAVRTVLDKTVNSNYINTKDEHTWLMAQVLFAQAAKSFGDEASQALAQQVADAVYAVPAAQLQKWTSADLAQALLLLAEYKADVAASSAVYAELTATNRLRWSGNTASLNGNPGWDGFGYSDEVIDSALMLRAITKVAGDSKELTRMARGLALGLTNAAQSQWYITRTMVWVAAGMKSFAARFENAAVTGTTTVNFANAKVTESQPWASRPQGMKVVAPWKDKDETLSVTHAGTGNPWVSIQTRQAIPGVVGKPIAQGLLIEKIVENKTRQTGDYQVGDMVEVTLNITAAAVTYHVSINDPIPAGSNIVGEAYGYAISYGEKSYRGYQFYTEALPQGLTTVKYQFQLNNVGTFNLPPTRAEGIYMPSIFGETASAPIVVK